MDPLQEAAIGWNGGDPLPVELPQPDDEWWDNTEPTWPTDAAALQCATEASSELSDLAGWTNHFIASQMKLFQQQNPWIRPDGPPAVGERLAASSDTVIPQTHNCANTASNDFDKQYRPIPDSQTDAARSSQFPFEALASHSLQAGMQPPSMWPQAMTVPSALASPSEYTSPLSVAPLRPFPHSHEDNELQMASMMTFLKEPWEMPDDSPAGSVFIQMQMAGTNLEGLYHTTLVPSVAVDRHPWVELAPTPAVGTAGSVSGVFFQDPTISLEDYATGEGGAIGYPLSEDFQHDDDTEQADHKDPVRAKVGGHAKLRQLLEGTPKPSMRRPVSDPTTGITYRSACQPCFEWMRQGSGCNWSDLPNRDPTESCDRCRFYGVKCDKTVVPSRSSRREGGRLGPKRYPVRAPDGTIYRGVCSGCTGHRKYCDWTDQARDDAVIDINKSCSNCTSRGVECDKKVWTARKVGHEGPGAVLNLGIGK